MADEPHSDYPSGSLNIIINIWQSIEPFLFLEDTISTAQTCKTLHELVIDLDTGKVKVSHFTAIRDYDNYAHHLPLALNSIHYPSLKRLKYPPRHSRGNIRWLRENKRKEATAAIQFCFPIFVVNLSHAQNLECLVLEPRISIVQTEYDGQPTKWILDLLSRNLAKCHKLKELDVSDNWQDRGDSIRYSSSLMQALTQTIIKRNNDLERLTLKFEGLPTDIAHSERNDHQVANEFFTAVLSARKLISLVISNGDDNGYTIDGDNANALLRVGDQLSIGMPDLQSLSFENRNSTLPLSPLLASFGSSYSLQKVDLHVPPHYWAERRSNETFSKLIMNKPMLETLDFWFGFYSDKNEELLQLLIDFALHCKSNNDYCFIKSIYIAELQDASVSKLCRLAQLVDCVGLNCETVCWIGSDSEEETDYEGLLDCTADTASVDYFECKL